MVATKGVAANWFWWSLGIAHVGMFLFWARLWRRSEVVTDAELVELRYGGAAGAGLRTAKAIYFALIYNAIVLGWVIAAMRKIALPFVRWEEWLGVDVWNVIRAAWPAEFLGGPESGMAPVLLVALAAGYSTLGGLRGVVVTDIVQLALALVGSIALVVLGLNSVGGLSGLSSELSMGLNPRRLEEVLAFAPPPEGLSFLSVQAFSVYLLLRWWASPTGDGGGYIAQRLMAARSPDDARQAAGVFVVFHYVLRPWPWILVGLIGLVVFPVGDEASIHSVGQLVADDREMAYPALASAVMGPGVLGVLLVSLLAAFMSTVDTHLNWGVSYVANDLWKVYVRPDASPREIVRVGRVVSIAFAVMALVVANQIGSVEQAWKFVAALGSGLGLPVLLRWLWWRTNAQAEIAGALGSLSVTLALVSWGEWNHPFFGSGRLPWEYEFALAVVAGAVAALSAIWVSGPPGRQTLVDFYARVRPPGLWAPIRKLQPGPTDGGAEITVGRIALAWTLGAVGLGAAIFAPGHLLLGSPLLGGIEALTAVVLAAVARHLTRGR